MHQEIIEQQLEVETLGNQIAVDKRKQEIKKQRIKEDQERTRKKEQSAWGLEKWAHEEENWRKREIHEIQDRRAIEDIEMAVYKNDMTVKLQKERLWGVARMEQERSIKIAVEMNST